MKLKSILFVWYFALSTTVFGQLDLTMMNWVAPANDTLDFSVAYVDGCFSPSVQMFTFGSGTVLSDEITMCWVINNGAPECNPFETSSFSIGWGMNLQSTYWDTICINPCQALELMCYVTHPNDPDHSNDTLRVTLQDDCTSLGLNDLQSTPLQVLPNPASDQITIRFQGQAEDLRLVSADGRILASKQNPSTSETIDLTGFNSGIYFVEVISKNHRYISRIVTQ